MVADADPKHEDVGEGLHDPVECVGEYQIVDVHLAHPLSFCGVDGFVDEDLWVVFWHGLGCEVLVVTEDARQFVERLDGYVVPNDRDLVWSPFEGGYGGGPLGQELLVGGSVGDGDDADAHRA